MLDYIDIGSNPSGEDLHFDVRDDVEHQKSECRIFIDAIRKVLGTEPEGANLRPRSNRCDAGVYYEVVCYFNNKFPDAIDYAYRCESESPEYWKDAGMVVKKVSGDLVVEYTQCLESEI